MLCCAVPPAQVSTEHTILAQLAQQELSFKVPTALPALKSGEPYVVLSNGAAACVFEIIPGKTGWRSKHTASTLFSVHYQALRLFTAGRIASIPASRHIVSD